MSVEKFDELLRLVEIYVFKTDTVKKAAIPARLKLEVRWRISTQKHFSETLQQGKSDLETKNIQLPPFMRKESFWNCVWCFGVTISRFR